MIAPEKLVAMYDTTYRTLKLNLRGITDEESRVRPEPAGNSINWVVGHLLLTRHQMLGFMGQPELFPEGEKLAYVRGADEGYDAAALLSIDDLKERFAESQEQLQEVLLALTEDALGRKARDEETVEDRLLFLNFHEAYHVGQLGLLRRFTRRPGAIR